MPPVGTVTDSWSDEARQILADGARAGRTAEFVTQAILDVTGEVVAERTVSRRMKELREEADVRAAAQQRMQDLVAALRAGDGNAMEYVAALGQRALELEPDAFMSADVVKVQRLTLRAEELRLKKQALDLKAREVSVSEQKLQMLQERETAAKAALEDTSAEVTPEMRVAKVREILGL